MTSFAYFGTDKSYTREEFHISTLAQILKYRPIEILVRDCEPGNDDLGPLHRDWAYEYNPDTNVHRRRDVSQTHSIYQEEVKKDEQNRADINRVRELAQEIDNCNSFPMFVTASENVVRSATHMATTPGSDGYYAKPNGQTGPNGWNIHPFLCFEYHKS